MFAATDSHCVNQNTKYKVTMSNFYVNEMTEDLNLELEVLPLVIEPNYFIIRFLYFRAGEERVQYLRGPLVTVVQAITVMEMDTLTVYTR